MTSIYLKEYFKNKNISQYEIEKKTGIARSKINLSFNNKRKLTADELIKISIVFDINLEDIKRNQVEAWETKNLISAIIKIRNYSLLA